MTTNPGFVTVAILMQNNPLLTHEILHETRIKKNSLDKKFLSV